MQPLGTLRLRLLACLQADNPRLATFFDPPADRPIFECLHEHLGKLYEKFSDDPYSRIFVAAGMLTFGDLPRADDILNYLPRSPVVIDHGAGWCALVACETVAAVLPIPPEHRNVRAWIQGSAEASAVTQWLNENRSRLLWNPSTERFKLKETREHAGHSPIP
jgi:hypothetical protein